MGSVLTLPGADGRSLPDVQPSAGTVTGSPFTVTSGAAVNTPVLTGIALVHSSELIHIRISKGGTAATTSTMPLPPDQIHRIPMDADILSMIAASTSSTVHIEMAKTLS